MKVYMGISGGDAGIGMFQHDLGIYFVYLIHSEVIVIAPFGWMAVVVRVLEVLILHVEDDHVERHWVAEGDLARLSQRVAAARVRCCHVACGAPVGRADAVTMDHARPGG